MYSWHHRTFDRKGTLEFQLLLFSSCKALTVPFVSGSWLPNLVLEICSAYHSTWSIASSLKYSVTGTIRKVSLVFFFATSGYIHTVQWKQIIFFLFAVDVYGILCSLKESPSLAQIFLILSSVIVPGSCLEARDHYCCSLLVTFQIVNAF